MKNRDKTMKNDETEKKQWKLMTKRENTHWKIIKNREKQMKNYEEERKKQWRMLKKRGKNNEQWWNIAEKIRTHDEK